MALSHRSQDFGLQVFGLSTVGEESLQLSSWQGVTAEHRRNQGQRKDDYSHRGFELPGARPHYSPDRPGQVEHIRLDLVLDFDRCICEGVCTLRITPIVSGLTHFTLDAVNQWIDGVKIQDVDQSFEYDGQHLEIELSQPTQRGETLELVIAYRLEQPQRGLYFVQPNPNYPQKPVQAWTQGEDEDSRYWFPCWDYPGQLSTSEIRVSVPEGFVALSNGDLLDVITVDDRKIYHWFQGQVHPTYLMTLAAGQFVEIKDSWQGKPINYFVDPGQEESAQITLGKTPAMVEFFSQIFGYPYPFPKYTQVCVEDFIFGGMENTSTTLLTNRCLLDQRAALDSQRSETLVAHELVHQWFGDLLVIRHWSHAWLKEGMATYGETLWITQDYGADEGAYYQWQTACSYLAEDASRYRRPLVTHVYREPIELYDRHLYEKGACVYHLLRHTLGEQAFWNAIQTFLHDNAHQTIETVDLLRAIEKATGRNVLPLFDQYVYRGGHPDYKVSYHWDKASSLAKLTIKQTQANPDYEGKDLFDLVIPVGFGFMESEDSDPTFQVMKIRVHEAEQTFYFPFPKKPSLISFDVDNATLKTVVLDYPLPLLKAQLRWDPDPISRIHAATAIAKKGGLEAVKILGESLKQEPFWGVRCEVIKQLATLKLNPVETLLIQALGDENSRVRAEAVSALSQLKTVASYQAIRQMVENGDPSYYTEAAAIAALGRFGRGVLGQGSQGLPPAPSFNNPDAPPPGDGRPDYSAEIVNLLGSVLESRPSWNETLRSAAIRSLSQLPDRPETLTWILNYTVPGVPQPLRHTAIRALGPLSLHLDNPQVHRILEHLEHLGTEPFFLTQMAVIGALQAMEVPQAVNLLTSLMDRSQDGRSKRSAEEAIARVQKRLSNKQAIKTLQDELQQMKQTHQDLLSRLEALEAKTSPPSP